jgi:hypothetical protein
VGVSLRHPSREALAHWLAGDDVDSKIDDHLRSCERCAAVVEELATTTEPVGEALALVLAPPPDLTDRLEKGVSAKLSSRQMMGVVADLFGAGFETARLLFTGDTSSIEDDHDDE